MDKTWKHGFDQVPQITIPDEVRRNPVAALAGRQGPQMTLEGSAITLHYPSKEEAETAMLGLIWLGIEWKARSLSRDNAR